jgi:hypothetical protein
MLGVWTAEALRERPQHGAIARFGTVDEIAHTGDVRPFPVADSVPGRTGGWDGSPPSSVLPVAVDHATKVWEQRGNLARLAVRRPVMAPGGNGKRNGGGRSRRIWSLTG